MKQLLFIIVFSCTLMAGNSWAQKAGSTKSTVNLWLTNDLNISSGINITAEENLLDEQESNGIDGLHLFANIPEVPLDLLKNRRSLIHPGIYFAHQIKILSLITDLPPPQLS